MYKDSISDLRAGKDRTLIITMTQIIDVFLDTSNTGL